MLVLPSHPEIAISSIKAYVKEERINEAVQRILKFKQESLENYKYLDDSYFGSVEHAQVVKRVP